MGRARSIRLTYVLLTTKATPCQRLAETSRPSIYALHISQKNIWLIITCKANVASTDEVTCLKSLSEISKKCKKKTKGRFMQLISNDVSARHIVCYILLWICRAFAVFSVKADTLLFYGRFASFPPCSHCYIRRTWKTTPTDDWIAQSPSVSSRINRAKRLCSRAASSSTSAISSCLPLRGFLDRCRCTCGLVRT